MGYRNKKNPWHVIFDEFKETHPDIVPYITANHCIIYPVILIDLNDSRQILYHGKRHVYQFVDDSNYNRVLFDMICPEQND